MNKERGKTSKVNMFKTDKHWTLDDYAAVRALNKKSLHPKTRRTAIKKYNQIRCRKTMKEYKGNKISNRHRA